MSVADADGADRDQPSCSSMPLCIPLYRTELGAQRTWVGSSPAEWPLMLHELVTGPRYTARGAARSARSPRGFLKKRTGIGAHPCQARPNDLRRLGTLGQEVWIQDSLQPHPGPLSSALMLGSHCHLRRVGTGMPYPPARCPSELRIGTPSSPTDSAGDPNKKSHER